MSAICQVLSLMFFPSDQNIWPHFTLRAHTFYLESVRPNGKKITHATQALTYVLKYSGSAKRAQPDQEWKDDVNDHVFLFPYFPSTVEPVSSGHLVLTLKLPGSNC